MSVYSETTKPSFKVSFKDWRDIDLDDDELSLPTLVSACERGAKVFTLILRDLQGELERHADIPEVIAQDAKDLIALVSFYFHGPLRAVLNTSERWDVMQNSYSRVFDGLHESVRLVQSILDRPSAPARIVQNMEASSRSKSIVEISSRSPIELLLRAVTAHQRWDRLEDLCAAYQRLQVTKAEKPHIGLPSVVFVCRGISTNDDPVYVIATSADHYKGYGDLNDLAYDIRKSRRMASPMTADQLMHIAKWSEDLFDKRKAGDSARLLVKFPLGHFSHEGDIAAPLKCPSFQPTARCIRCQALFRYTVTEDVLVEEAKGLSEVVYRGFTCAETYAHFFCQDLQQHGHAKVVVKMPWR